MPNIKISDLPPVTLPLDAANVFLEVQATEAGEDVSRKIAADDLQSAFGLDATFVTVTANAILPNERILTAGADISIVDGGAGNPITINVVGLVTTLAGLSDVDLSGQATGDLLFNVDGTNWNDTAGLLRIDEGLFEFQSSYSITALAGIFIRNANGDVFLDNAVLGGGLFQYTVSVGGNDGIRIRDNGLAQFGMSGGTEDTTLISGVEVLLVRNGVNQVLGTLATGVELRGALNNAPGSGGDQDVTLELANLGGVTAGSLGYNANAPSTAIDLTLENVVQGGALNFLYDGGGFQVLDAGDVSFRLHPADGGGFSTDYIQYQNDDNEWYIQGDLRLQDGVGSGRLQVNINAVFRGTTPGTTAPIIISTNNLPNSTTGSIAVTADTGTERGIFLGRSGAFHQSLTDRGPDNAEVKFDDSTDVTTDPGLYNLRMDNATPASVTEIAIDDTLLNGQDFGTYWGANLAVDDKIFIKQVNDDSKYIILLVTNVPTDSTGWWRILVSVEASGVIFDDDEPLNVQFNQVVTDAAGAGASITFDLLTDINTATPPTTENVTGNFRIRDAQDVNTLMTLGYNATEDFLLRNFMRGGELAIEVTDSGGAIFTVFEANPASGTTVLGDRSVILEAGGRTFLIGDGFSSPFELNLFHNDILTAQTAARLDGGMELINNFNDAAGAVFVRVLTANDISIGLNVVRYDFSAGIGGAPSSGVFNFNNATPASVTEIRMNDLGEDSIQNSWLFPELADGDLLTFRSETQNGDLIIFKVTGVAVDNTGDWTIPVSHVSGGLPTTNAKQRVTWQQFSQAGTVTIPIILLDNEQIRFGTGADVTMDWDGVDMEVEGLASGQAWNWRDGMTMFWYGADNIDNLNLTIDSAANTAVMDSSGINSLSFGVGNYQVRFANTLNTEFGQLHHTSGEFQIATGSGDGDIVLLREGVQRSLVTKSNIVAGTVSSVEILDSFSNVLEVGFALMPIIEDNPVGLTLGSQHVGQTILMDDDTAFTVTVPASSDVDFPVGGITTLINANSAAVDITISDNATGTLFYLDGSSVTDIVGTALVGPGGVANIFRRSTTEWFIWGTGITP